tara:strand:+ start:513 stop:1070 length:558 start_codon:yes stop_codon:yes gene_type:complete
MTNSQILIIHNFPILFTILNENKSILNFEIENVNNDKINEYSEKKNLLIISGEKNLIAEKQIKISQYPINFLKLVEIININFLKNKFNQQNKIQVGKYYINLNSRTMSYKNKVLSLTEKEIKIINYLNIEKKEITINKLQSEVWGYKSKLETHTVETHVYRLRKKIENKFNDNSFILSTKNGYKI